MRAAERKLQLKIHGRKALGFLSSMAPANWSVSSLTCMATHPAGRGSTVTPPPAETGCPARYAAFTGIFKRALEAASAIFAAGSSSVLSSSSTDMGLILTLDSFPEADPVARFFTIFLEQQQKLAARRDWRGMESVDE